jgi:hypothetical protein
MVALKATSGSVAAAINYGIIHELAVRGKVFVQLRRERLCQDGQDNGGGKGNGDLQDVRMRRM